MAVPDNVTVVRRWTNEGFGQGKVELVAEDFVNHSPVPGQGPGREGVAISRIAIFRVEDGQIKENWNLVDMLGALQQPGAIPPPHGAPR
jgi:hypothetical protein